MLVLPNTPSGRKGTDFNPNIPNPFVNDMMCGTVLFSRYAILNEVGRGTFTTIYSAYDFLTSSMVAVKVFNAGISKEDGGGEAVIEREKNVIKSLCEFNSDSGSYSSVCTPYFVDYHKEVLVMELIQGEDLHDLRYRSSQFHQNANSSSLSLSSSSNNNNNNNNNNNSSINKRFLPINPLESASLFSSFLKCLKHMHAKGWLHRDVKPSNFVRSGKHWKIVDFGLSKCYIEKVFPYDDKCVPWSGTLDGDAAKYFLRPSTQNAGFRGTTMYCSLSSHESTSHSRVSDIISAIYTYIDLCNGDLPWRKYSNGKNKDKEEVFKLKKRCNTDKALLCTHPTLSKCAPFVQHISEALDYLDSVGFYGDVDYEKVISCINKSAECCKDVCQQSGDFISLVWGTDSVEEQGMPQSTQLPNSFVFGGVDWDDFYGNGMIGEINFYDYCYWLTAWCKQESKSKQHHEIAGAVKVMNKWLKTVKDVVGKEWRASNTEKIPTPVSSSKNPSKPDSNNSTSISSKRKVSAVSTQCPYLTGRVSYLLKTYRVLPWDSYENKVEAFQYRDDLLAIEVAEKRKCPSLRR